MAVKYPETIDPEILESLKEHGITEKDFYNHCSDLYIGCSSMTIAKKIIKFQSKSIYSTFFPQIDSDMAKYPVAVEIAFGYVDGDFKEQHPNRR